MKPAINLNLYLLLLLFFVSSLPSTYGQGFLKADGKMITDASGKEIILRGIGLGGWMLQEPYMLQLGGVAGTQHEIRSKIEDVVGKEKTQMFYDAWLQNHCRKADIDSLKQWGFNSVRLPMHYNLFTPAIEEEPVAGKNTWIDKGFTMVDSLLNWCKANQVYLILDLHAAPGGQGHDNAIADRNSNLPSLWQSEANRQKTIEFWKALAARYANEEWIGAYDLLNETNWGFENETDKNGCAEKQNEPLKALLKDISLAIRSADKNHMIIIEGNCWGNNYSNFFPLWDKNMAVSFHKYWNTNDQKSLEGIIKIRDEQNVPIWCGESGENSNVWFTDAISLLEKNKIGWAWWPLKKLGTNNPLEIKRNEGYNDLLNYWKHKTTEKPSADNAFKSLMQLTEDIKAENCIPHKDVIDAMFRQVNEKSAKPFLDHRARKGNLIFATDYDLGDNGIAYFDNDTADYHVSTGKNTPGNKGRVYRNDGVDIEVSNDTTAISNGFNVYSTEPGEWLQYTITAPHNGKYKMLMRAFTEGKDPKMNLIINSKTKRLVFLPSAAVNNKWVTIMLKKIPLNKGTNNIRIEFINPGFKLSYITFR